MRKDVLGWRRLFGVLGPSTNTVVQPDFDDLRVPGVTNHYSRIYTPNVEGVTNDTFVSATQVIADNTVDAIRSVMTCNPHYLVMGMSAVTFYGGKAGAHAFHQKIVNEAKIGASIGSHACTAALRAYGGIKRIAFLSPYYPAANEQVQRYFEEEGFTVVKELALRTYSFTAISEFTEDQLIDALHSINAPEVQAIVQVGTNLSMVRLAAAAEKWFRKPVIAINTATYWHALRANGIQDQLQGFGRLMSDF
jgi:maleate isomerase